MLIAFNIFHPVLLVFVASATLVLLVAVVSTAYSFNYFASRPYGILRVPRPMLLSQNYTDISTLLAIACSSATIVVDSYYLTIFAIVTIATLAALLLAIVILSRSSNYHNKIRNIHVRIRLFSCGSYDSILNNFLGTGEKAYRVNFSSESIVVMRGEEARKALFYDGRFGRFEGYKIGAGNALNNRRSSLAGERSQEASPAYLNHFHSIMNEDRLSAILPVLITDFNGCVQAWGKVAKIDGFKEVYNLVFKWTLRIVGCSDLADDHVAVKKLSTEYSKFVTSDGLVLPWLATLAKRRSTLALYNTLFHYVELRRKAVVRHRDAIDVILRESDDSDSAIQFILDVIQYGVLNTSVTSYQCLSVLATHHGWRDRVILEISSLVRKYMATNPLSIHHLLATIPISAWEAETPSLDLVIDETIRLTSNGAVTRRTLAEDVCIEGSVLERGDSVAYPLSDVHLNPDIFWNPTEFDPSRFASGREEHKGATLGFLGWGAGRHPCAGMKAAKLEIKLIVASFVLSYDFDLVDGHDQRIMKSIPQPNKGDIHQARPSGDPRYFKLRKVVD